MIVRLEWLGILDSLSYEVVPVEILDGQVYWLWTKDVASVKVLWRNHKVEVATWDVEEDTKSKYPFLFSSLENHMEGMRSSSYFCFPALLKERLIFLHHCFLTKLKVRLMCNGALTRAFAFLILHSRISDPSGRELKHPIF